MDTITGRFFTEERALFRGDTLCITDCAFDTGESALKHSSSIRLIHTVFRGKYPLWYSKGLSLERCTLAEPARAALWYSGEISLADTMIAAPKALRRCSQIRMRNISIPEAVETLWDCRDVTAESLTVSGDYFGMNCEGLRISKMQLNGKYCFDGLRNAEISDSVLIGRDVFWNSENVTVRNSFLSGAYIGWNSKNLTLENCTVESLQGFCYIENLRLVSCRLINTTLAFEHSTVEAVLDGTVDSILNPKGGHILMDTPGAVTLDPAETDPQATEIRVRQSPSA